jgi:hypothetical protein
MRLDRTAIPTALALSLAACSGGPDATAPSALSLTSGPTFPEAVTGSAHVMVPVSGGGEFLRRLTFTARRSADGSVEGSWQLVASAAIVSGDITCFTIQGATIWVGGVTTSQKFSGFQVGTEVGWRLMDGGEGSGTAADAASRLFMNAPAGSAQSFCSDLTTPGQTGAFLDLFGGNVQIHS